MQTPTFTLVGRALGHGVAVVTMTTSLAVVTLSVVQALQAPAAQVVAHPHRIVVCVVVALTGGAGPLGAIPPQGVAVESVVTHLTSGSCKSSGGLEWASGVSMVMPHCQFAVSL